MAYHVSKAAFGQFVEQVLAAVPAPFAQFLEEVVFEVRDHATPEMLTGLGVRGRRQLLGLYHGRPRTRRSIEDSGQLPDIIYIFQEPIELVCRTESDLKEQIRVTVLHEVGHHFGLDEDDLSRLGYS